MDTARRRQQCWRCGVCNAGPSPSCSGGNGGNRGKWGKWENQPLCQVGQQREGTGAAQPHHSWKTVM